MQIRDGALHSSAKLLHAFPNGNEVGSGQFTLSGAGWQRPVDGVTLIKNCTQAADGCGHGCNRGEWRQK
jgi:hypothetical protein